MYVSTNYVSIQQIKLSESTIKLIYFPAIECSAAKSLINELSNTHTQAHTYTHRHTLKHTVKQINACVYL